MEAGAADDSDELYVEWRYRHERLQVILELLQRARATRQESTRAAALVEVEKQCSHVLVKVEREIDEIFEDQEGPSGYQLMRVLVGFSSQRTRWTNQAWVTYRYLLDIHDVD